MLRLKTIRQGGRVAIWDEQGRVRFVDGPRRLLLFRKTVQPLHRFSAHADQYLSVQFAVAVAANMSLHGELNDGRRYIKRLRELLTNEDSHEPLSGCNVSPASLPESGFNTVPKDLFIYHSWGRWQGTSCSLPSCLRTR